MGKSLADLKSGASLPERAYSLCVAQGMVSRAQMLEDEITDLRAARAQAQRSTEPARLGSSAAVSEREQEIADELRALYDAMDEHTAELHVRALPSGEWRRWVDAHPARGEDEKGHDRDQEVAGGWCNADALIDDLGLFVRAVGDEELARTLDPEMSYPRFVSGDWDTIAGVAAYSDLKQIARAVVAMHESEVNLPKLLALSRATLSNGSVSSSPEPSESAPDVSTAGSPESSTSTSTTTTDD